MTMQQQRPNSGMNRELNLFENYMKMTRFNVDDLDILCKLDDFLLPHTPQSLDEDVTAEPMSYQEEQLLKSLEGDDDLSDSLSDISQISLSQRKHKKRRSERWRMVNDKKQTEPMMEDPEPLESLHHRQGREEKPADSNRSRSRASSQPEDAVNLRSKARSSRVYEEDDQVPRQLESNRSSRASRSNRSIKSDKSSNRDGQKHWSDRLESSDSRSDLDMDHPQRGHADKPHRRKVDHLHEGDTDNVIDVDHRQRERGPSNERPHSSGSRRSSRRHEERKSEGKRKKDKSEHHHLGRNMRAAPPNACRAYGEQERAV